MPSRKMSDEQWISALQECRKSGMTDKDWCAMQGIHPSTLYKAIKRLRKKACEIPARDQKAVPLKQEIVEVASIDENGVMTRSCQIETVPEPCKEQSVIPYDNPAASSFEATVRISMPSGIKVELSNSINAATIRNVLGVLQMV